MVLSMMPKLKAAKKSRASVILTSLSAWVMATATLIGLTQHDERRQGVVNSTRPAYVFVDENSNNWNRNDSENETVHMPTKFDVGLHITAVGGRK